MISEGYFECIFTDGTKEDFDKMCTSVEGLGGDNDMVLFKVTSIDGNKFLLLQIIPKSQIKQIINHYAESDLKKIRRAGWENLF